MDTPLVSVLVPTYLHEDYIAPCLESILGQRTAFPFEVIVGIDCSPDNTETIVQEFATKYSQTIRVVSRSKNVGAMANFQDLLQRSRGKYLAICEGDDEWIDPLKLQKQYEVLEANPHAVLVFTDIDQYYVTSGKRVSNLQAKLSRDVQFDGPDAWFEAIILLKTSIHTPTVFTRTECYREACKDIADILSWSLMADTPLFLALTRYGDFVYLPISTALMNRLPESLSRSQSGAKKAEFQLSSIMVSLAVAQKFGYTSKALDSLLGKRVMIALRFCALSKTPELSDKIIDNCKSRVRLNWRHMILCKIAKSSWMSRAFRNLDNPSLYVRRLYRRIRYGVESSV